MIIRSNFSPREFINSPNADAKPIKAKKRTIAFIKEKFEAEGKIEHL